MERPLRYVLTDGDFKILVEGGTVTAEVRRPGRLMEGETATTLELRLSDIGVHQMVVHVDGAVLRARDAAYVDESFPERKCDHCEKLYRGPAVYCSWICATLDV